MRGKSSDRIGGDALPGGARKRVWGGKKAGPVFSQRRGEAIKRGGFSEKTGGVQEKRGGGSAGKVMAVCYAKKEYTYKNETTIIVHSGVCVCA